MGVDLWRQWKDGTIDYVIHRGRGGTRRPLGRVSGAGMIHVGDNMVVGFIAGAAVVLIIWAVVG